jgi:hypothetical protein
MERDILMAVGVSVRGKAGKAAAAAFLASVFILAGTSCGRKEVPSASGGGNATMDAVPAPSGAGAPPARSGVIEAIVNPLTPSRSVPPAISVKSAPGHGAEVLAVRWFVNGTEQETASRLSPSLFRRGDRIHAVASVRSDGREVALATPDVVAGNALPVVSDVRIEPRPPYSGGTVSAVVQGQDPDGDPLKFRYQWYADNVPVGGALDTMTLTDVKRGSWIRVVVTPNDGFGDGAWGESPRYQVVNAPPVVKSALPAELPPSRHFVYRIVAVDPDGDPLSYSLSKAPPGMVLKGETLEWEVPDDYIGRPVEAVVEISDDHGGRTDQNISMTIQPPK